MQTAALSIIKGVYKNSVIVNSFTAYLGYNESQCSDVDPDKTDSDIANTERAQTLLNNAGLLDQNIIENANKPHWLYANVIIHHDGIDNITSSSLY